MVWCVRPLHESLLVYFRQCPKGTSDKNFGEDAIDIAIIDTGNMNDTIIVFPYSFPGISEWRAPTRPRTRVCPDTQRTSSINLLKVNDIFDVQCLKFWYKFVNKKLPNYFRDMFKYNYELHEIGTRSHDQLHLYPTRTSGARNVLRHHIPELLNKFPKYLIERIKTHSLYSIFYNIKCYLIDLYNYNCTIIDCYICNNNNWVTNRLSGNLGPAAGPWSQAAARVVDMTASGVGGDLRMVTGF